MDILLLNTPEYVGKLVDGWKIDEVAENPLSYVFYLERDGSTKVFFIRKTVILGSSLNLNTNVYELRYKDYEDSKLLTLSEVLDVTHVVNEMKILIAKYIKFDK